MRFEAANGTMPARGFDWDAVEYPARPVREFAELRYGKALREPDRRPGSVPVFGTNGPCGWHDEPLAAGPGVILGRKGQGHLGVKWCQDPFWVIDTAYYADVNQKEVDLRWFYYITEYVGLDHLKTGEKPGLNRDVFGRQLFPFPSLREQRAIARILGALDDKIELNRQMNATLEGMARALFKSWFVDFDPVTAKAAGRQPFGLSPALAALFPSRFVGSPPGPIPEGWTVGELGDVYDLTMGQSPPGRTYNEDGIGTPFYQGRTDFGFRFPTRRIFCTEPTRFAEVGDTLVSVRAPVGDINMAAERCAVGRGVAGVRHKNGRLSFGYYQMWSLGDAFDVFNGEGTLFGAITKVGFAGIDVVVPRAEIADAFERLAARWDEQIEVLEKNARTLAATRDALLPQLLSGAIRLRQAEKLVEEVV